MFFYIAHSEADQAAADELKGFLKSRGLIVETETGARGFRHLQPSDVVIALWSKQSVFGAYRMQLERRMLDAWADGRLVLVKLDHGLLPVGMRDLPAIDAGFENGRRLSVWPQVERAGREAMNKALVARQADKPAAPGSGEGIPPDVERDLKAGRGPGIPSPQPSAPSQEETGQAPARFASRRGSFLPGLLLLLALGGIGWAAWALIGQPRWGDGLQMGALAAGAVGALVLLVLLAVVFWPAPRTRKRKAVASSKKKPAEVATTEESAELFVSYAHADNDKVKPVIKVVEASGRTVWMDRGGIQAGEGWAGEIVRGIKGARGVMVMCSPQAFESDHIKREVYLADRYKKPMLPIFIEAAQPPEDFEYFFASVQWLELFKLPEADRPAAIGRALAGV